MHRAVTLLDHREEEGIGMGARDTSPSSRATAAWANWTRPWHPRADREPHRCRPDAARHNALINAGAGHDLYGSGIMLLEEMVDAGMPLRAALMVSVLRLVSESVRPD